MYAIRSYYDVGVVLGKLVAGSQRHFRGIDNDIGSMRLDHVGIGRMVEQDFVVEFGCHVGTGVKGREQAGPVKRIHDLAGQFALYVATQKVVFEILENTVSVEAKIGCRKTSSYNFV